MERTPRYQLTYPTSSDEVDDAPQQFKTMCESVENALATVDDRQTTEAVKPVVRTTLAQLADVSGVTGQTGYVTGDGDNNGAYVWSGSAWVKYAMKSDVDALADQITQGYESGVISGSTSAAGAILVAFSHHSTSPRAVFVGYNPNAVESVRLNFTPVIWAVGDTDFQVRLRDDRNQSWTGIQPVSLYWIAIW